MSDHTPQRPSVNRVVHYYDLVNDGEFKEQRLVPRAAIVTATAKEDPDLLNGMLVHLFVMDPHDQYATHAIEYSDKPRAGCWSWPPVVR